MLHAEKREGLVREITILTSWKGLKRSQQIDLRSELILYLGCLISTEAKGSYYTRFEALEPYLQSVVNGSGHKPGTFGSPTRN